MYKKKQKNKLTLSTIMTIQLTSRVSKNRSKAIVWHLISEEFCSTINIFELPYKSIMIQRISYWQL